MELQTKPEFDSQGELTPVCIADLMDEVQSHHAERMARIKAALLKLKRGHSMTIDYALTFNAKERE